MYHLFFVQLCIFIAILCRKLYKVQATVLQEDEEKVVVEESFQPKSFPDGEEKGNQGGPPDGAPSNAIEGLAIKIEQSINVFLTVVCLS